MVEGFERGDFRTDFTTSFTPRFRARCLAARWSRACVLAHRACMDVGGFDLDAATSSTVDGRTFLHALQHFPQVLIIAQGVREWY